jgi:hypothetical protein
MKSDALTNPIAKTAIEALQNGDQKDQWGDFQAYFKFQLSPAGKINRLDIGQAS